MVISFRAEGSEHERWKIAAEAANMSFSAWARRALNSAAELDEALARQVVDTPPNKPHVLSTHFATGDTRSVDTTVSSLFKKRGQ